MLISCVNCFLMTLIWCLFVILDFDFHHDKNILRDISNLDVSDSDEFQPRSSVLGKVCK